MAFWAKKNNNDWVDVKKIWVKKTPTTWVAAKKIWIKKSNIWSQFWPDAGPFPETDIYLSTSSTSYPSFGTTFPELTLTNYHWFFDGSLTLKYKWEYSNTATGPWTSVSGYETYQTYSPGNPSLGSSNSLSFTPNFSDYVYGKTYFKFNMQATDSSGISTYEVVSDGISIGGPYWYQTPSFSGTPSPGYTITWDAGIGRIQGSSTDVGYMTTIYRTNDNGITKEYLVGTASEPDYAFNDNYQYVFNLLPTDSGYTYYASTYSIYGDPYAPIEGAEKSVTISVDKKIVGPPGEFSITSFTKNQLTGTPLNGARTLTLTYGAADTATEYQYKIERSIDNSAWYSWFDYYYNVSATTPTTAITITDPDTDDYRYYRANMRATNESGLYTYSTNTNVSASGTPPSAVTITGSVSGAEHVHLEHTLPSSVGSGLSIARYEYNYKLSSSPTWGSVWGSAYEFGGDLTITGLFSGTAYDFKIRAVNDDGETGPESNVFSATTVLMPSNLTNVHAKSFDVNQISIAYTTGDNTTSVYYYAYRTVSGPNEDPGLSYGSIPAASNSSGVYTITVPYAEEFYSIDLYPENIQFQGTGYGTPVSVTSNSFGNDKPQVSIPSFTGVSGTGFTVSYTGYNTTSIIIDIKTNGSSISGYPQTLSQASSSTGTSLTHTPATTLLDSTTYTVYLTPYYQHPSASLLNYTGVQRSSSVSTLYQFSMGKALHIGTNGYIGLTGASASTTLPVTGTVLSVYAGDFVQAQTVGGSGSGLLHYWSDSTTYVIRWNGYRYNSSGTYLNNANYRVTYEAKFYTNQSYCDIKYIHVGANVWSTGAPTDTPGIYSNGSLVSSGIPGPYILTTGSKYRIYYNGALPTATFTFTDVEQADMVNAGDVTGGSSDDGYTSLYTTTNQYTLPTISFGTATLTGSSISIPLSGTYYSYDYTIKTGSYSGTTVAFGNNQTNSTISASGLTSGTTYYVTASPKNSWSQYGNDAKNTYISYTVTFNGNSNTSGSPSVSSVSQTTVGGSVTLATVGTLARTGYSFGGWNTNAAGTGTNYSEGASYTPSSNITLYAKWYPVRTLSYDANGGTGAPSAQTASDTGSGATFTISSTTPTRSGYTFSGWNTNSSGTGTNYSASGSITITSDTTLYAKWTVANVAPYNGSVSVSPNPGTAPSTTFTATPSGWLGTPSTFTYSYQWQYMNQSFSWINVGTNSSTYTPPIITPTPYSWRVNLTVSNGVSPNGTASSTFTVNNPAAATFTIGTVSASKTATKQITGTWTSTRSGGTFQWWNTRIRNTSTNATATHSLFSETPKSDVFTNLSATSYRFGVQGVSYDSNYGVYRYTVGTADMNAYTENSSNINPQ